ncbi:MAG: hypothetical protein NVS4B7_17820 [Ktedonobacteraceae bacterium]
MGNEEFSIIIWCWHGPEADITQLRVVRVDTGKEVSLKEGVFLVRISTDAKTSVVRCFIRHIASGSEAYIQSGAKLDAFVKDCLLKSDETTPPPLDSPGE